MYIAIIQLECGRALHKHADTFSSPGFPKSQKYKLCVWRIAVAPGERDGHSKSSPVIGRYCGKRVPPLILSTGNRLWIKYQSSEIVGKQGFKASYKGKKKFAW